MTDRHFTFSAAGTYTGGQWELGGELDAVPQADFAAAVSAALTIIAKAVRDEYPAGYPFRITRLTIEQVRLQ